MDKPRPYQNTKEENIWKDLSKSVFLARDKTKYNSTQCNGIKLFLFQSSIGWLKLSSWSGSVPYMSLS